MRHRFIALLFFCAAALRAEAASAQDATRADALFTEGRRLVAARRYAEACAKFAESQRLDHGVGTLLNLADCYELNGQTASAWTWFKKAAAAASAEGQAEREHIARDREAALRPVLAKLTIALGGRSPAPGTVVKRDDVVIERDLWGVAVAVDPGDHLVAVSAPGKTTWLQTARVSKLPGARVVVFVPPLADDPRSADHLSEAQGALVDPSAARRQRVAGLTLGAGSLAAVIVGSALGIRAIRGNVDAEPHCMADRCDAEGAALRSSAIAAGNASTVVFAFAGAALVGSAVLYLTAPGPGRVTASVRPGGLALEAAW